MYFVYICKCLGGIPLMNILYRNIVVVKIKILRPSPLMEYIANMIKSVSNKLYYCFPSLMHVYQQKCLIWPISVMLTAVWFLCTCSVMDDAKSLTCIEGELFLVIDTQIAQDFNWNLKIEWNIISRFPPAFYLFS